MVRIEGGKDVVIVKFPYNIDYIAKIKNVKRYKWHPDKKC
jgi:hypothetical protein